jgi:hypothetical protein
VCGNIALNSASKHGSLKEISCFAVIVLEIQIKRFQFMVIVVTNNVVSYIETLRLKLYIACQSSRICWQFFKTFILH